MKITQAVQALSALAQESRLRVFRLLVQCGPEGIPAGRIAEELEIPAATLSFHLKELAHAGLVQQQRQGRSLIYSLHAEAMSDFLAYLMEDCCQGRPELCQPGRKKGKCKSGSCNSAPRRKRQRAST